MTSVFGTLQLKLAASAM